MSDFNHFKYEWFDPYGPFAPLYMINDLRLNFLKTLYLNNTTNIIDVGCGAGIATNKLPELFPKASIFGLDASKNAIQLASHYATTFDINTKFIHQSALSPIQGSYDLVTCFELIEHLDTPETLVQNLVNTLNKDGTLVLSTLDRSLISFIQNILIAEDLLGIIEPGTHDINHFLRPSELIEMVTSHGLTLVKMSGFEINPLNFEASLSQTQFSNYIVAFKKV